MRIVLALTVLLLGACASPVQNRDPTGELFPNVAGNALSGEAYRLPEDLAGKPALLLVAYEQDTQFDVDRWLFGLLQSQTTLTFYEVPTIAGWVPGLFERTIDNGMRAGIPDEDEPSVITIYDDAEKLVQFTGNERKRSARAILLDDTGRVIGFHDAGYSARVLLEFLERVPGAAPSP